jgi:hypothetical protein
MVVLPLGGCVFFLLKHIPLCCTLMDTMNTCVVYIYEDLSLVVVLLLWGYLVFLFNGYFVIGSCFCSIVI